MKTSRISGIIIVLVLTAIVLEAQERAVSPVSLDKITERVYQLMGGRGSNGGVIIGENAVLVVDSKMDEVVCEPVH